MDLARWEGLTIDEMLEFVEQGLPNTRDTRHRDNGHHRDNGDIDAEGLRGTIQDMCTSLTRIEQDIRELRQKLGIA